MNPEIVAERAFGSSCAPAADAVLDDSVWEIMINALDQIFVKFNTDPRGSSAATTTNRVEIRGHSVVRRGASGVPLPFDEAGKITSRDSAATPCVASEIRC